MTALESQGLQKTYPGATQPALRGLDLAVAEGEFFGLLGPNGAGKTTAISIFTGLRAPSSGTVRIFGHDLQRADPDVRRRIGLVPQDIALYPTLTVRENLQYFGGLYGLHGEDLRRRVADGLARVALSDSADRPVDTLSGGMKRRANLAAGLVHGPTLLFLDEPTVGVDAQSRAAIVATLEDLSRAGVTIIYTTHYLEEAERLCGRVAIIDNGRVLASGAPRALVEGTVGSANLEDVFLHLTGRGLRD
jgi:ABC-2 type transport system ATP-binding protein